jgi:hypothetical protein
LQSALAQSSQRGTTSEDNFIVRFQISRIIQELFNIDPLKACTESIVIGILGLYAGSVGPGDRVLLDVMERIDEVSGLNLLSSPETWNAFRNRWSRSHVEVVSSSLSSPFSLIDANTTKSNAADFKVVLNAKDVPADQLSSFYQIYDPKFWLPIIAYCLDKVTHSSEVLLLIENYAIGYTLVCLSSQDENIRKMAGSLLVTFEGLAEVSYY